MKHDHILHQQYIYFIHFCTDIYLIQTDQIFLELILICLGNLLKHFQNFCSSSVYILHIRTDGQTKKVYLQRSFVIKFSIRDLLSRIYKNKFHFFNHHFICLCILKTCVNDWCFWSLPSESFSLKRWRLVGPMAKDGNCTGR